MNRSSTGTTTGVGLLAAGIAAITFVSLLLGWGLLVVSEPPTRVTVRRRRAQATQHVRLNWPPGPAPPPPSRTLPAMHAPPRRRREAVSGQVPRVEPGTTGRVRAR